jgi:penicillin G amidase
MLDPNAPMRMPNKYRRASFLATDSTSPLYDNHLTDPVETRADIVKMSLVHAMAKLRVVYGTLAALPDWGHYKHTMVHHLSPTLDAFSRMDVSTGGYRGIINATSERHGPSWRMIVDLGDMHAYCVYPGGESGNPGSRYYDDMIDKWAKGEYYTARYEHRTKLAAKHLYQVNIHP